MKQRMVVGPAFVVAGAARAGTTGLVEGLRHHPALFVTQPKEPHYLALHGTTPQFRGPGDEAFNVSVVTRERDYLALFPDPAEGLVSGEASVSTLFHPERALPELLRLNPQARMVILLREPVARAWSSFQYLSSQGREPESDFLVALEQEESRREAGWHHLWQYAAMSRYADSVAACREALGPHRVGIWFHDDLERDWSGTLRQVTSFLGVPPAPGDDVPSTRVNISGTPRHPRLQRTLWWAAAHPTLRRAARAATSWRMREAVRGRLLRRDGVPPEVAAEVAPRFADDLARLRDLLGPEAPMPTWLEAAGTPAPR